MRQEIELIRGNWGTNLTILAAVFLPLSLVTVSVAHAFQVAAKN